jgi:VIT1/CCC1 family predicted Fe2+/Mn2+ transporter
MQDISRFSFGVTAAVITGLAVIVGLDEFTNPKMSIIGALLVMALADNITDSLGIHIYRESQFNCPDNDSHSHTVGNFLSRLGILAIFVLIIYILPIAYAVILSIAFGLLLLSILSYLIAKKQGTNPFSAVLQHVGIAVLVILGSHLLGRTITTLFSGA